MIASPSFKQRKTKSSPDDPCGRGKTRGWRQTIMVRFDLEIFQHVLDHIQLSLNSILPFRCTGPASWTCSERSSARIVTRHFKEFISQLDLTNIIWTRWRWTLWKRLWRPQRFIDRRRRSGDGFSTIWRWGYSTYLTERIGRMVFIWMGCRGLCHLCHGLILANDTGTNSSWQRCLAQRSYNPMSSSPTIRHGFHESYNFTVQCSQKKRSTSMRCPSGWIWDQHCQLRHVHIFYFGSASIAIDCVHVRSCRSWKISKDILACACIHRSCGIDAVHHSGPWCLHPWSCVCHDIKHLFRSIICAVELISASISSQPSNHSQLYK